GTMVRVGVAFMATSPWVERWGGVSQGTRCFGRARGSRGVLLRGVLSEVVGGLSQDVAGVSPGCFQAVVEFRDDRDGFVVVLDGVYAGVEVVGGQHERVEVVVVAVQPGVVDAIERVVACRASGRDEDSAGHAGGRER